MSNFGPANDQADPVPSERAERPAKEVRRRVISNLGLVRAGAVRFDAKLCCASRRGPRRRHNGLRAPDWRSKSVIGRLDIEYTLDAFKMQARTFRVACPHLSCGSRCNVRVDRNQWASSAHGLELHFSGSFKVVKVIPGLRDIWCADHDAMVSHEQNVLVTEHRARMMPIKSTDLHTN